MSASHTGQSKNQTRSRLTGEGQNDLLTQEELAARLRVGLRTLVRLQHDGVIPCIVLGKSVRFHWPAVVSHLNANAVITRPKLKPEVTLPHPGPLPPGASGTGQLRAGEGDRIAKGGRP